MSCKAYFNEVGIDWQEMALTEGSCRCSDKLWQTWWSLVTKTDSDPSSKALLEKGLPCQQDEQRNGRNGAQACCPTSSLGSDMGTQHPWWGRSCDQLHGCARLLLECSRRQPGHWAANEQFNTDSMRGLWSSTFVLTLFTPPGSQS